MIAFLLITSLSIYFLIKKDIKYIISLTIIIISIISFLVLVDNTKNNLLINTLNNILTGNIKENENYSPLNLGFLFIMINILSFPFFIYGLKNLHQLLLYIPLMYCFTWIIYLDNITTFNNIITRSMDNNFRNIYINFFFLWIG